MGDFKGPNHCTAQAKEESDSRPFRDESPVPRASLFQAPCEPVGVEYEFRHVSGMVYKDHQGPLLVASLASSLTVRSRL